MKKVDCCLGEGEKNKIARLHQAKEESLVGREFKCVNHVTCVTPDVRFQVRTFTCKEEKQQHEQM